MTKNAEKLLARAEFALQETLANAWIYDDIYRMMSPFRSTSSNKSDGQVQGKVPYDSSMMIAAHQFVATMQNDLTPSYQRWANFKSGEAILQDKDKIDNYLESLRDKIFSYLDSSNFASVTSTAYLDMACGTMVMLVLKGNSLSQPFKFVHIPIHKVGIEEDSSGKVIGVYFKREIKYQEIEYTWDNQKLRLPSELRDKIRETPSSTTEFTECITEDRDNFVWKYQVIDSSGEEQKIIYEEHFNVSPVIVFRWEKNHSGTHGIGVLMKALSDAKTLNAVKKLQLQNAELQVLGSYQVDISQGALPMEHMEIRAGGMIPVRGNQISPINIGGNFSISERVIEDLQNKIKKITLDSSLPPADSTQRTKYEIGERLKELRKVAGNTGRMSIEYTTPLMRRLIDILHTSGIEEIPEEVRVDDKVMEITIVSPLAQQQNLEDVQAMLEVIQMTQEISPELVNKAFKIEDLPRYFGKKLGAPSKLFRTSEEMQEIVEAEQQALQQQAMAEQQAQMPQQEQMTQNQPITDEQNVGI